MKTTNLPVLHHPAPYRLELVKYPVTPARLLPSPLELAAITARARDSTQQPIPTTLEQPDEALEEPSLLRQRIALLEQALDDARQLAHRDDVTGIPNRRLLGDRFEHAKARSDRQRKYLAVLFLDIDRFKHINDVHGHVVGDDLLRRIAARLLGCIRSSDTVCRYGGDEFVILLPETDGRRGAKAATQNIREQLTAPYFTGTAYRAVPASIGTALYPTDGTELGSLIEKADSAMYCEKIGKRIELRDPLQHGTDVPKNGANVTTGRLE